MQLTNAELLRFVSSKNSLVRDLVIREYHVRPSSEVLEIAQSLTRERAYMARAAGYLILGQLGSPNRPFRADSMPTIMRGLETEKSISVRCAIAYTVGHLAPPRCYHERIIGAFSNYLDSERKSLVVAVAFGVTGLSTSDQLSKLVERLLVDGDPDIREWVEIGLDAISQRENGTKPAFSPDSK